MQYLRVDWHRFRTNIGRPGRKCKYGGLHVILQQLSSTCRTSTCLTVASDTGLGANMPAFSCDRSWLASPEPRRPPRLLWRQKKKTSSAEPQERRNGGRQLQQRSFLAAQRENGHYDLNVCAYQLGGGPRAEVKVKLSLCVYNINKTYKGRMW